MQTCLSPASSLLPPTVMSHIGLQERGKKVTEHTVIFLSDVTATAELLEISESTRCGYESSKIGTSVRVR